MAGLEDVLSEKELEAIKAMRKQAKEEDEREVKIRTADGHEATLPFGAARNWLRKIGVLIDDEDAQAEAEPEEPEEDEDAKKDKPVRFAGRRVS